MNNNDTLTTACPSPPDGDSIQTMARDNSGTRKKQQDAYLAGHDARTKQSALETQHAEKQIENALRASELSYRRLFEAAKDGILILDFETGRISDVNPFLYRLLGFQPG